MEQLTFAQQAQLFIANHSIMVIAWIALFIAIIINIYKGATSKFKVVEHIQATMLINTQDAIILDVRSDDEFHKGHIIDSIHLLPNEIKTAKTQSIEKYKTRPIIVADSNGLVSQGLANALSKQGFSQVYVLKDGIMAWRNANLPLVKNK